MDEDTRRIANALERIANVLESIQREGLSFRTNTDSWFRK
jgi:hypothetical protein